MMGMSDDRKESDSAIGLRRRVGRSLRALGTELDRLDEAVADRFGLHRTDLRCLEIIGRAGPLPAGRLATIAGLSTSAVTAVIDRTERAGYVRRGADPADRRRVLVDLTERGRDHGRAAFSGLMRETDRLLSGYPRAELELLDRFLAQVRALVVAQAEIATREKERSGDE
jgi:DNA-binding MarR family transcriptional regulator